jgi:hypothetical protein
MSSCRRSRSTCQLLITICSTQLAPVLRFTLPSGLCVYESKFCDVYGATLCFGDPHEVFTRGYKQAGFRVTTGKLQVVFTESSSAYIGGICAAVGASIEDEEAESESRSTLPAVVAMPPGPGGDAVPEEVISNLELLILFEPPKDGTEPDGAALAVPYI